MTMLERPARWLAMLLALAACMPVHAQVVDGPDYVVVQGGAETQVMPDRFPVHIELTRLSTDLDGTVARLERKSRELLDLARKHGALEDDIEIGALRSGREVHVDERSERETWLGNRYERDMDFTFRDIVALRAFLSALRQDEDMSVRTGDFTVSNADKVRRDLFRQAIVAAKANAQLMAEAAGRRLGPAHTVSDRPIVHAPTASGSDLDRMQVTGARVRAGNAPIPVVLEAKSIRIAADAYAIFRLVD